MSLTLSRRLATPLIAAAAATGLVFGPTTAVAFADSPSATTTTLSAPQTTLTGHGVDLVATVAPADATGTVQFKWGPSNIGAAATVNSGVATLHYTWGEPGNKEITAVYSGDANHAPSTSAVTTVVVSLPRAGSTTTLTAPAAALTGVAVDLSATVAPAETTGTVEFTDGATVVGSAPLVDGIANISHIFTTDGAHSITATYSGNGAYNPSTSEVYTVDVWTDTGDHGGDNGSSGSSGSSDGSSSGSAGSSSGSLGDIFGS